MDSIFRNFWVLNGNFIECHNREGYSIDNIYVISR